MDKFDVSKWNKKRYLAEAGIKEDSHSLFTKGSGNKVTITPDLTTDPLHKQGKTGTLIGKTIDGNNCLVEFEDGEIGVYAKNSFEQAEDNLYKKATGKEPKVSSTNKFRDIKEGDNKIFQIHWFDDDEIQFEGNEEECKEWVWNYILNSGDESEFPYVDKK